MNVKKLLPAVLASLGLFLASSQASLIVYEPFNYPNATVNPDADSSSGQPNGLPYDNTGGNPAGSGTGLRNDWAGTVQTGSLSYTGALPSNHNSLFVGSNVNQNNAGPWMYRNMTTDPYNSYRDGANALGAVGTTLYGSMLVSMSGIDSGDRFWLRLTGNDNSYNHITLMTTNGGDWTVQQIDNSSNVAPGTNLTINSAVAPTTATTLIVWSQQFNSGNTVTSFWINNTNTAGAANYVFTSNGEVNLAGFGYRTGNNTAVIDELRIGTTMADVIPEPSTAALLGLGLTGLAYLRRRQRAAMDS